MNVQKVTIMSRRRIHGGITIASGLDETSLLNCRICIHGGITIASGLDETSLLNFSRRSYGGITIISALDETSLHNFRRRSHVVTFRKFKSWRQNKTKVSLSRAWRHMEVWLHSFLTSALDAEWPVSFPGRLLAQQPPVGHGLLIHKVPISHTTTHHSR